MKDNNKSKLSQILGAFEANRAAAKKETDRLKTEHELFLEAFAEKARSVIRPAMEDVAEQLRAGGHGAAIVEQLETRDDQGHAHNAGITLSMFPLGEKPGYPNEHDCPHVAVMANAHSNSVYVHESTMMHGRGGHAGGAGEYLLEQISTDLVEQHILKVLSEAMGTP